MNATLKSAAQAVVDRWDSPLWKVQPNTAQYIERLRFALAHAADLQQSLIAAGHFLRDNTSAWHEVGRHAAGSTVLYHAPGWHRDAADAAPCDMGELCIGCTPRSEGGGCPGAAASLREAAQKLCDMDAADGPVHTMNQWRTAYRDLRSALAQQDEPLFGGDERRHVICLCPDCVRPTAQQGDPAATPMFWVRLRSDGGYEGPIHNDSIERVRVQSGAWTALYVDPQPAPVAQPLTDDQWINLAERHADADWGSCKPDGYLNAVKALVADAHKTGGAA